MSASRIDWDALRPQLQELDRSTLVEILGRAVAVIADSEIDVVLGPRVAKAARSASVELASMSLLDRVTRFHEESVEGVYYQEFTVNSRNCTMLSAGTQMWMDEAVYWFDRCAESEVSEQARLAFDQLWDLLDRIDAMENIIFFADEHASWQVPLDLARLLTAYFACLSSFVEPEDFAARFDQLVRHHVHYEWKKLITAVQAVCTTEQAAAISRLETP